MDPDAKKRSFNVAFMLLAAIGVFVLQEVWLRSQAVATIPYSEFQKLVRENKVARGVVAGDEIEGEYREEIHGKSPFVTRRIEQDLAKDLDERGVE